MKRSIPWYDLAKYVSQVYPDMAMCMDPKVVGAIMRNEGQQPREKETDTESNGCSCSHRRAMAIHAIIEWRMHGYRCSSDG